jgi:hypothetical protein
MCYQFNFLVSIYRLRETKAMDEVQQLTTNRSKTGVEPCPETSCIYLYSGRCATQPSAGVTAEEAEVGETFSTHGGSKDCVQITDK